MKKRKGFTLIELIAVLVIMAVVAIVVAPLILDTIKKAKYSVNMRSIDGYGRAVELAMASYQLENLTYPDSFDELDIEYNGNKVECDTSRINPDHTIYLSKCRVNGKYVKSDKNKDGYYHYGILKMTNIEYVDTYGEYLEKALKDYYNEHGEYPSDYTTLVIEVLEKDVSCDVSINYGGKVYLTNCRVNNEIVLDGENNIYNYGKYVPSYVIGDQITYNDMDFYVIEDSNTMKDYVTLLKAESLTKNEVDLYGGVGTENNHVNKYTDISVGQAWNSKGYGGLAYYSSPTCGKVNGSFIRTECTTDFANSDIKFVIDNWKIASFDLDELAIDSTGYNARLLKIEELRNNLGYGDSNVINDNVFNWVYNSDYRTWVMSSYNSPRSVWYVETDGRLVECPVFYNYGIVRPVVTLKKSALE